MEALNDIEPLKLLLHLPYETQSYPQVSYETKKRRLERYAELILSWSEQHNLVAKSTLPTLWTRHFLDSAQLLPLLPQGAHTLVDLGSGAGFPGLVLSCLGVPHVHLIESTGKKARFLSAVAEALGLNVQVHNERIEAVRDIKADCVTARALTALPNLMSLARPFLRPDSTALFLKGEKAGAELTQARKYWTFKSEVFDSQTSSSGQILKITNLKALSLHGSRTTKRAK